MESHGVSEPKDLPPKEHEKPKVRVWSHASCQGSGGHVTKTQKEALSIDAFLPSVTGLAENVDHVLCCVDELNSDPAGVQDTVMEAQKS